MAEIRYALGPTLVALFKRLRREQGAQDPGPGLAPGQVSTVPHSLRRDVGLPPVEEKPPPPVLIRIV